MRQHQSHNYKGKSSTSSNNSSQSSSNPNSDKSSSDNSSFQLPQNSNNRVGRWNQEELASLKLAMSIFGDQSWKKIQRFLIQRIKDSKKSRSIQKKYKHGSMGSDNSYYYTFRSIKAIQSKIYQVKPDVEREAIQLSKFSEQIKFDRNELNQIKNEQQKRQMRTIRQPAAGVMAENYRYVEPNRNDKVAQPPKEKIMNEEN